MADCKHAWSKLTFSRPSLKRSMIASLSAASLAPCKDATLCPSTVIRWDILSAVCRCCKGTNYGPNHQLGRVKLTDLTENDTLPNRQKLIEGNEDIIFLFLILAIHVKLSNVFHAKLLLLQLDFVWTGGEFGRKISDMVWEGGGEQNDLDAFARE